MTASLPPMTLGHPLGYFDGHQAGILVDHEILQAQGEGLIRIDPFTDDLLEPATYDLRVGDQAMVTTTSKVIDLRDGAGLLVIEPGAMGVLQTLERIELSKRVVGRIGPKSFLIRRGLHVCVGPQIDPGFRGRLVVNLINLSPRPFALHRQDRFLSAEFHLLASEPNKGYAGPYQDRDQLTTEEIQVLLAYQGPSLADLHRGFAELRDNIQQIAALGRDVPRLIDAQERTISAIGQFRSVAPPTAAPLWVPITSFAPEPYELLRQPLVVIQQDGEGYTASLFEANIHASGDTEEEALRNLKDLILDVFDSLSAESPETLGPEPTRQLAVLKEFIGKRQ
jgi:dCTP deaminase